MLASTIWAPVSASWAALTPFTVARVPTGMNRGVVTTPWGVWKQPQRARLRWLRAEISKWKVAAAGWAVSPPESGVWVGPLELKGARWINKTWNLRRRGARIALPALEALR